MTSACLAVHLSLCFSILLLLQRYRAAASSGVADAQFNLGNLFSRGRGVRQSDADAVKWYAKAALQGHAAAAYNVGVLCERGRGTATGLAAAGGATGGLVAAGGVTVGQQAQQSSSDAEAVRWYTKAAEAGHAAAMNNLGLLVELGRAPAAGVASSVASTGKPGGSKAAAAYGWYAKAAALGSGRAMSNLAFLLETTDRALLPLEAAPGDSGGGGGSSAGNGAGPDLAEAGRWYREALAAGEASAGAGLGRVAKVFAEAAHEAPTPKAEHEAATLEAS
jgi:TPR repeat protein